MSSRHAPLRRVTRRQAESTPAASRCSFLLSAARRLTASSAAGATPSGDAAAERRGGELRDAEGSAEEQQPKDVPAQESAMLGAELCRRALQVE